MSVKAIRLQNFMAFEDTDWIELRPITLLFGRNSSGKSAIIRALRLLKQSIDYSQTGQPLTFVTEQGLDQGRFRETVHNQNLEKSINFHFRADLERTRENLLNQINYRRQQEGQSVISPEEIQQHGWQWADLNLGFSWNGETRRAELAFVSIDCPWAAVKEQKQTTVFRAERELEKYINKELDKYSTSLAKDWQSSSDLLYDDSGSEETFDLLSNIQTTFGFLPTLESSEELDFPRRVSEENLNLVQAVLDELCESVKGFLAGIEHLGPIRPEPQRTYLFDILLSRSWQQRGLSAWLDFIREDVDEKNVVKIKKWLQHLDLGEDIELEKVGHPREPVSLSAVRIHEALTHSSINLKDMGFGASQVFPIIVQSVVASVNSLIIIEQPELHLHPSAQATLGDLFIQMANSGVRFLIETHSENLLLRFRRRIAQTSGQVSEAADVPLKIDNFKAYFVDRRNGASNIEALKFDKWGDYEYRPPGFGDFFGQDFEELMKMKKARRGRA